MKQIFASFLLIILLGISSCSPTLSPSIEFKNFSNDGGVVKNMKVIWNGYHLLKISGPLSTCGMPSQNFSINNEPDFFGPVHIEWENAKGEKLTKDFIFSKDELPSYKIRNRRGNFQNGISVYVALYFSQSDVEYYTSDNPRIKEIEKEKSGDWLISEGKCIKDAKMKWGTPSHNYSVNGKNKN